MISLDKVKYESEFFSVIEKDSPDDKGSNIDFFEIFSDLSLNQINNLEKLSVKSENNSEDTINVSDFSSIFSDLSAINDDDKLLNFVNSIDESSINHPVNNINILLNYSNPINQDYISSKSDIEPLDVILSGLNDKTPKINQSTADDILSKFNPIDINLKADKLDTFNFNIGIIEPTIADKSSKPIDFFEEGDGLKFTKIKEMVNDVSQRNGIFIFDEAEQEESKIINSTEIRNNSSINKNDSINLNNMKQSEGINENISDNTFVIVPKYVETSTEAAEYKTLSINDSKVKNDFDDDYIKSKNTEINKENNVIHQNKVGTDNISQKVNSSTNNDNIFKSTIIYQELEKINDNVVKDQAIKVENNSNNIDKNSIIDNANNNSLKSENSNQSIPQPKFNNFGSKISTPLVQSIVIEVKNDNIEQFPKNDLLLQTKEFKIVEDNTSVLAQISNTDDSTDNISQKTMDIISKTLDIDEGKSYIPKSNSVELNNEIQNIRVENRYHQELSQKMDNNASLSQQVDLSDNNFNQSNNNSQNKQNGGNPSFENLNNIDQVQNIKINTNEGISNEPNTPKTLTYISKLHELSSKISTIVSKNINSETTTARINLSPKSLGTLVVEISQKKDDLKIVINAESKNVANLIEQNIGGLKEKLINQGINSQNIELNINVQTQTATLMNKGDNKDDSKNAKQDRRQNKYAKSSDIIDDINQSSVNYTKYDSGKFIEKYI